MDCTPPLLLTLFLAAPTCAVRDAAERGLSAQGVAAYPALMAAAESADLERQTRAARLLAALAASPMDGLSWRRPAVWIDSLPLDYPERTTLISRFRGEASAEGIEQAAPIFLCDVVAGQFFFRWLAQAGRTDEAKRLLPLMQARCRLWRANAGYTDEPKTPMGEP